MRVLNQTNYNTATLETMTRHVTKGFTNKIRFIIFKYTRKSTLRGKAKYFDREILVDIGKNNTYPFVMNRWHGQYFPKYEVKNDLELIYCLLLHEARHFWQQFHNKKTTECKTEKWVHKKFEEWINSNLYIEWQNTIYQPNPIPEPKPQQTEQELKQQKLAKVQKHIKRLETRIKRLNTILKKWKRKEKRLLK